MHTNTQIYSIYNTSQFYSVWIAQIMMVVEQRAPVTRRGQVYDFGFSACRRYLCTAVTTVIGKGSEKIPQRNIN